MRSMSIIHHSAQFTDWGNDKIKNTFLFCEDIMDRDFPIQIRDKDQIYITAGDRECLGIANLKKFINEYEPFNVDRRRAVNNLCFDSISDFNDDGKNKKRKFERILRRSSQIELDKIDIVMGCDKKMTDTLEVLGKQGFKNMVIGVSCTNKLIGTDVDSIMRQCHNCQITEDLNYLPQDFLNTFTEKYKQLLSKPATEMFEKNSINFLGYSVDRSFMDFVGLFRMWGIKINEIVLPRVRLDKLSNLFSAEINIVNDKEYYYPIYDALEMLKIKLAPPYGWYNSLIWIEKVTRELNLDMNIDEWSSYIQPREKKWRKLKSKANNHKVLFVFSSNEAKFIIKLNEFFSYRFNMVFLLEEMGFEIQIIMFNIGDEDFENVKAKLNSLSRNNNIVIEKLVSENEIDDKISKSSADIIYSDLYFDERAASLGMATFSYSIFEYGYDGAIASLERILSLCEMKYFKRYKKFHNTKIYEIR